MWEQFGCPIPCRPYDLHHLGFLSEVQYLHRRMLKFLLAGGEEWGDRGRSPRTSPKRESMMIPSVQELRSNFAQLGGLDFFDSFDSFWTLDLFLPSIYTYIIPFLASRGVFTSHKRDWIQWLRSCELLQAQTAGSNAFQQAVLVALQCNRVQSKAPVQPYLSSNLWERNWWWELNLGSQQCLPCNSPWACRVAFHRRQLECNCSQWRRSLWCLACSSL